MTTPILNHVLKSLSEVAGINIQHIIAEKESREYDACTFEINGKKIIYRQSKITPNKTGQFVTTWKRNAAAVTVPFDAADTFYYIIIASATEQETGMFVFPKQLLIEKGIVSHDNKNGKRGIRVYPPWDATTSKQASATQQWQRNYFINLTGKQHIEKKDLKGLFS